MDMGNEQRGRATRNAERRGIMNHERKTQVNLMRLLA